MVVGRKDDMAWQLAVYWMAWQLAVYWHGMAVVRVGGMAWLVCKRHGMAAGSMIVLFK